MAFGNLYFYGGDALDLSATPPFHPQQNRSIPTGAPYLSLYAFSASGSGPVVALF